MKKYLVLFIAILLSQIAYSQNYIGGLHFNNGKLYEKNDSLYFCVEVTVNGQAIQRRAGIRIVPKISYGTQSIEMPDVMVQGQNKNRSYNRSFKLLSKKQKSKFVKPSRLISVNPKEQTAFIYTYAVPYELWMDDARLTIYEELIDWRDERSIISVSLDNRVQLASRIPYQIDPMVNYIAPAAESKSRKKQGQAFLDFQVARAEILPNYRRNPNELAKIQAAFQDIQKNDDVKITGLFIEGYASPEGKYETNERLSRERAIALKNYILGNFNVPLSESQIKLAWMAEDWDGLKVQVESSDMARKDEVLAIIDGTPDLAQRKVKLQRLRGGAPYAQMLQEIYPQLRRVEYQIDFSVKNFSVEETKAMIGKNNSLLSHLELYQAAQTYDPAGKDFEKLILDVAPQLFPEDPVAYINAAAAMIQRGENATAKRYLEKYADDLRAWNNLGVIYMIEGDLEAANEMFKKASRAGIKEAEHNMKEIAKKTEDNLRMQRFNKK